MQGGGQQPGPPVGGGGGAENIALLRKQNKESPKIFNFFMFRNQSYEKN
jgi:hypothetical protein